jgi:hypothetical protein
MRRQNYWPIFKKLDHSPLDPQQHLTGGQTVAFTAVIADLPDCADGGGFLTVRHDVSSVQKT